MNERAASIVGVVFAIAVVVLVMNSHVCVDIAYDIQGVARPSRASAPRYRPASPSGFGAEEIVEVDSPTVPPEARVSGERVKQSSAAGDDGLRREWSTLPATIDESGEIIRGQNEAASGDLGDHGPSGSESGDEVDGGVGAEAEDSENGSPSLALPRLPAEEAPILAVLRCDAEAESSVLWVAGATNRAVAFPVSPLLPGLLQASFNSLPVRPRRLGVVWSGCAEEQLRQTFQTLSTLCSTELGGLMIYDLSRGRQLPACGI